MYPVRLYHQQSWIHARLKRLDSFKCLALSSHLIPSPYQMGSLQAGLWTI
jgi:hypothetical protein